ncbi:MAG TPA: SDR family NAD(P)-dependent oxidoreductase [Marmoricola sp.]|nr:SDR family NAD(P)-dependent oxidoreductase [Marmoricola sp.]
MRTLEDKVVVITGAASGIGRALALETARRGAVLALSDVDFPGLQETARRVEQATGRTPRVDQLDVRDREAWQLAFVMDVDFWGVVHGTRSPSPACTPAASGPPSPATRTPAAASSSSTPTRSSWTSSSGSPARATSA